MKHEKELWVPAFRRAMLQTISDMEGRSLLRYCLAYC
jgi:hypothetical protein